jgi:hypothetical protein
MEVHCPAGEGRAVAKAAVDHIKVRRVRKKVIDEDRATKRRRPEAQEEAARKVDLARVGHSLSAWKHVAHNGRGAPREEDGEHLKLRGRTVGVCCKIPSNLGRD